MVAGTSTAAATASSMLSFAHTRSASPKSRFSTRTLGKLHRQRAAVGRQRGQALRRELPSKASEASSFWAINAIARACIVSW